MEQKKRKEDLQKRLDNMILKEIYLLPQTQRDRLILNLIYEKINSVIENELNEFLEDFRKNVGR